MNATIYALAADLVLLVHLAFIIFVVAGGLLVLRWPRAAWAHLPAAVWGVAVEAAGWICPLTPLENALRERAASGEMAGSAGTSGGAYAGDFIGHYLLPLIYPDALTRELQWLLAALVLAINALIYRAAWRRHGRRAHGAGGADPGT